MLFLGRNTQRVNIFQCKYHLQNLLHEERRLPSWHGPYVRVLRAAVTHCNPSPASRCVSKNRWCTGKICHERNWWKTVVFFFLNSAATRHLSRRSAPRGTADVVKTEDASKLDNSFLEQGEKDPRIFYPSNSGFMQVFSRAHPSVVGEILASPCLLNSPVLTLGICPVLLLGSVVLPSWAWFMPLLLGASLEGITFCWCWVGFINAALTRRLVLQCSSMQLRLKWEFCLSLLSTNSDAFGRLQPKLTNW